tara:strand:- start:831 stop:1142 length:312 start_codon:yes stop_codon:yes gene_type:complete
MGGGGEKWRGSAGGRILWRENSTYELNQVNEADLVGNSSGKKKSKKKRLLVSSDAARASSLSPSIYLSTSTYASRSLLIRQDSIIKTFTMSSEKRFSGDDDFR